MKTAQDHTSFASIMEGRYYEADTFGYRFSLNGQEKDDEIYGKGNTTTAEFWEYDGRLFFTGRCCHRPEMLDEKR
jgi:hypothetical protein